MNTLSIAAAALITSILTSACGGGGGSGSADSTSFNLDQAFRSWYEQGQSVGLRGTDECLGTQVHVQGAAETSATFESNPALAATVTRTTFVRQGCALPSGVFAQTEFFAADFLPLGRSGDGEYGVHTSPPGLPTAARIGDRGAVGVMDLFTDATRQQALGREEISYAVETGTAGAGSAIATLITRRYSTGNVLQSTTQRRYSIAANAIPDLISEDLDGIRFTH